MSIQTDLARIKNAKSSIKAAIEGKGVTVPDGTLLDGMASLIESIEAGGGDTLFGYNLLSGTITLSEETTDPIDLVKGVGITDFSHGFCVLWYGNLKFSGGNLSNYINVAAITGASSFGITSKGTDAYNRKMLWVNNTGGITLYQNSTYKLKPGVTYCWIVLYN